MARGSVAVRDAVPSDAAALVAIWAELVKSHSAVACPPATEEQAMRAVQRLEADPSERLVVAIVDDMPVGVAHLRRAPVSPLHDEDAVHVGNLHVLSRYRRRGVGSSLVTTAADWAEDKGSRHIVAAAAASARDSNRFLARRGMNQVAVVRATTATALRARLSVATPRPVSTNVVAARRLRRRSRSA